VHECVVEASAQEKELFASVDFDTEEFKKTAGATELRHSTKVSMAPPRL
jgi:hypothetical protein